jgi:peroxiredoxin
MVWLTVFVAVVVGASLALARRGGVVAPVGHPAPQFTLPNLQGRLTALSSFGPGNIALRFSSVNCTICDPDWAVLARWQALPGAPRIVAIEVGQPPDVVGVRLHHATYPVPVLIDASGAVAAEYGVRTLPAFAFIDRFGRIVAVQSVTTRTGIWPDATWLRFVGRLQRADAAPALGGT